MKENKIEINGVSKETFNKIGDEILDACCGWIGMERGWEEFIASHTRTIINLVINDIKIRLHENETK